MKKWIQKLFLLRNIFYIFIYCRFSYHLMTENSYTLSLYNMIHPHHPLNSRWNKDGHPYIFIILLCSKYIFDLQCTKLFCVITGVIVIMIIYKNVYIYILFIHNNLIWFAIVDENRPCLFNLYDMIHSMLKLILHLTRIAQQIDLVSERKRRNRKKTSKHKYWSTTIKCLYINRYISN